MKNPVLNELFDAVIFLTWSDWETEPRSNRYHYASRFAQRIPVIFVQNLLEIQGGALVSPSGIENLDLVNVSLPIKEGEVRTILDLLRCRGIKNPLVWIYDSLHYGRLLSAMPRWLRVYHATEDYFTRSSAMQTSTEVSQSVKSLLLDVDLVVAVSDIVLNNLVAASSYSGATVVAENACDNTYFSDLSRSLAGTIIPDSRIVIYQGAVNSRLDYELLYSVASLLPDYRFRFAGRISANDEAERLSRLGNVEILGEMPPDDFSKEMLGAAVGIIPFIQDDWIRGSFPLKFFEYVACGLPVVSVPIDALAKFEMCGNVVEFASTAAGFSGAIERLSTTRNDLASLQIRRALAEENSYDKRFEIVVDKLSSVMVQAEGSPVPLNMAILYDPDSCHVRTVKEHLKAFQRYSTHDVTLLPAANLWGITSLIEVSGEVDFSVFDVVVVHYSIRLSKRHHLVENLAISLESFHGLKVLFIQDECKFVECARAWMDRLEFDLVYTCVPISQRELVYPSFRFPATDFLPTLNCYVPESVHMERFVTPHTQRNLTIAYRGPELPAIYRQLSHEQCTIGVEVKRLAEERRLPVDIACDAESRMGDDAWCKLLGSARATLGTESGANVFDFDGSLAERIERIRRKSRAATFDEIRNAVLKEHDGNVRTNQVSPKLFEAIRLRTALILFEGDYSGVVKPGVHYIPLRKDFSNFDDVVSQLMNDRLIKELTDKAYDDVVASGKYSYSRFVEGVDVDLRVRCLRRVPRRRMYGSVYALSDTGELRQCLPAIPLSLACAADVLDGQESFQGIQEKFREAAPNIATFDQGAATVDQSVDSQGHALRLGKRLILRYGAPPIRKMHDLVRRVPVAHQLARNIYVRMPSSIKSKIKKVVKGG